MFNHWFRWRSCWRNIRNQILQRGGGIELTDFRTTRAMLTPEAFAMAEGEDVPPTDLIPEETWRSMMSLPDDVSLRTSDHHGSILARLWELWGWWPCLVGGLQQAVDNPVMSPIAFAACDATDDFQASIHNAVVGYYRLAYTALRAVVENLTIGLHLQLAGDTLAFEAWLAGDELKFGWAADCMGQHDRVSLFEGHLKAQVSDDLFRQRQPGAQGGLARRLFGTLSKFTHADPEFTDGDIRQSNGPIYVPEAFQSWTSSFLCVYSLGVIIARLAQPAMDELPWSCPHRVIELLQQAVAMLPASSDKSLLEAAIDCLP